jgi:hypothetical protein
MTARISSLIVNPVEHVFVQPPEIGRRHDLAADNAGLIAAGLLLHAIRFLRQSSMTRVLCRKVMAAFGQR